MRWRWRWQWRWQWMELIQFNKTNQFYTDWNCNILIVWLYGFSFLRLINSIVEIIFMHRLNSLRLRKCYFDPEPPIGVWLPGNSAGSDVHQQQHLALITLTCHFFQLDLMRKQLELLWKCRWRCEDTKIRMFWTKWQKERQKGVHPTKVSRG